MSYPQEHNKAWEQMNRRMVAVYFVVMLVILSFTGAVFERTLTAPPWWVSWVVSAVNVIIAYGSASFLEYSKQRLKVRQQIGDTYDWE